MVVRSSSSVDLKRREVLLGDEERVGGVEFEDGCLVEKEVEVGNFVLLFGSDQDAHRVYQVNLIFRF